MKILSLLLVLIFGLTSQLIATTKTTNTLVYFETDKHQLSHVAQNQLDSLIKEAKSNPDFEFFIEGHTDNRGALGYNDKLSLRRSEAVKMFLLQMGVGEKQISMSYKGELTPISPNTNELNRGSNRRVEVRLTTYRFNTIAELEEQLQSDKPHRVIIDPTVDNRVVGTNGVQVLIPKYSFQTLEGDSVTEEVNFELVEALKIEDFIVSGLETKSNDALLETGGMVKLSVQSSTGEQLQLAKGRSLILKVPNDNRQEGMEVFVSDEGSNWTATNRPITNAIPFEEVVPFPTLKTEKSQTPSFTYLVDMPQPPKRPIIPREPHKPREQSYFRNIPWYKFKKDQIKAHQQERYNAALDRYDKRLERYEKRVELYESRMELYEMKKKEHTADVELWNKDRELAFVAFLKSPRYLKALKIQERINQRYKERYAEEIMTWRDNRRAYAEQWGLSLDDTETSDDRAINQYVFAVNTLNWINIDRFLKMNPDQKQDIILTSKDVTNEKVLVILKKRKSMLACKPNEKAGIFALHDFPKKEEAFIFAYKVEEGRPLISFMEMNGSNHYQLDFVGSSLAEIKSILGQFNKS